MEIIRSGRIHHLAPIFETKNPATLQGFTTRHEGVSRPPYNSLNLGFNTDDPPHNVEGNRSLLARTFGISQERLVTVRQNHGADILVIDQPNDDLTHFCGIEADAIITNQPGIMIGVTVADCVPLLLFDPVNRVIAAIHAGWRGVANDISAHLLKGMQGMFGSNLQMLKAAIGPAIRPCCYQVDPPVKDAFQQLPELWQQSATADGEGRWRLDLPLAVKIRLEQQGIPAENIQSADQCVCCQKELFFSHRRDKGETGRQIGFIMLKG